MGKSLLAWVIGLCAVPQSCAAMWQVVSVAVGSGMTVIAEGTAVPWVLHHALN